jgi:hypothetical protein
MEINIKEIIFETVEPPNYNRKKRKRYTIFFSFFTVLILFGGFFLTRYSTVFMVTGIILSLFLMLLGYLSDKKTVLHVVKNGILKIDKSGFLISQEKEIKISFDKIKFINYYFDRPLSTFSDITHARTYVIKIRLFDNSTHEFYVKKYPLDRYNKIYKDFDEVMDAICKNSRYFFNRIRYKE